jgi:hypothetical protein
MLKNRGQSCGYFSCLTSVLLAVLLFAVSAKAGPIQLQRTTSSVQSGYYTVSGKAHVLAYTGTVSSSGAAWMMLRFTETYLGKRSYIEVVNGIGKVQRFDATRLSMWSNLTAELKGDLPPYGVPT